MPRKPTTKLAEKDKPISTPEIPAWACETPAIQYTLEAFFDEDRERVELTLDEYETLKRTIAKMRGYEAPEQFERRHH